MPQTYTLTSETHLYSYIDISQSDADKDNPPTQLAIDKTIVMLEAGGPTIVKSDDKVIVHGTELNDSQKKTLAKLFYFNPKTLIYKSSWEIGSGYCFIGVNSEGDSILSIPKTRGPPVEITTFKLPLKFDWSKYGVMVPGSDLAKTKSEVNKLNDQLSKIQQEFLDKMHEVEEQATQVHKLEKQMHEQDDELTKLRLLEEEYTKFKDMEAKNKKMMQQQINNLEHKLQEKDEKIGKTHSKVKELKQQLNKVQHDLHEKDKKLGNEEIRVEDLKQQVMWEYLKSKDKWVQENMRQLLGSRFDSPIMPTFAQQKEFEKNKKLDEIISLLRNVENIVKHG